MTINLKKRIYTSFGLLFLLSLMFIDNFALGYFLIVIGILSFLEFAKIIQITSKKNKFFQLVYSLLFLTYIFLFCYLFFIFSFHLNLKIIIFLFLIVCIVSDIAGFIFGKTFKGPKLTKISPNKTISGFVGSLLLSGAFSFFSIYYITNSFDYFGIVVGFGISIACQVGDLFFSFLKRSYSLKDTGNILPGHGGVLDRIDGILFGLPVGFLILLLFY